MPVFHAAIFAIPVCCLSWGLDKWGARTFMASRLSFRAVHELVRLDFKNKMGSQAASTFHMKSFGSRSAVSLSDFGSALCAVQQFLLRCMPSFRSL